MSNAANNFGPKGGRFRQIPCTVASGHTSVLIRVVAIAIVLYMNSNYNIIETTTRLTDPQQRLGSSPDQTTVIVVPIVFSVMLLIIVVAIIIIICAAKKFANGRSQHIQVTSDRVDIPDTRGYISKS